MEDCILSKIEREEASGLLELAIENGGNRNLTEKNVLFWYFNNPTQSKSMWKVEFKGKIEGYATTNNFVYNMDGVEKLVALPQNVLTSNAVRGKGLFGKLYYKTESENLTENKVDFFLTSTGEMSTPIFLQKFDYLRAVCPNIIVKLPGLLSIFKTKNYRLVGNINDIEFENIYTLNNSRKKNLDYYKWRYGGVNPENLKVLEIVENSKIIGYAFLIEKKKKGVKALILADVLLGEQKRLEVIIEACHVFAVKNFYPVLVFFEVEGNCKTTGVNIVFKNHYNFLVKGKTTDETKQLSLIPFNFFFGDLDFFW